MFYSILSKLPSFRFRHIAWILLLGSICQMSIAEQNTATEWIAPPEAANTKNPVSSDKKSIKKGKKLYRQWCSTCHGTQGNGDGPSSLAREIFPPDLSDSHLWRQSEGAIFWKISEGRTPMLNFKDFLTKKQRWHIINYLRTLSPQEKK